MTIVSYVFIRNELTFKLNVYLIRNKDITIELMFPYPMQSDWDLYKIMKKEMQRECRKAYNNYVNNLFSEDDSPTLKNCGPLYYAKM